MYGEQNHLTLSERIVIEAGIYAGNTLGVIARKIGRQTSTVSREIRNNRTLVKGERPREKDCNYAGNCTYTGLCGDAECTLNCVYCHRYDCRNVCKRYQGRHCVKLDKAPFVCNTCPVRRKCKGDRAYYSAQQADAAYRRRLSLSRSGIRTRGEDFAELDKLVTTLVRKGQPLTHIYAEHADELPISQRSLYNYIDSGALTIRNIDLRRKTGYRPRKKKAEPSLGFANQRFRSGRSYDDYQKYMVEHPLTSVVEMDTVKGVREQGKRLLTMIFCQSNLMLMFLMKDGKVDSVIDVFDHLTSVLGLERFRRLFPVILTDNGTEFKRVHELEQTADGEQRTKLFYCDPQASWQKPHIEKNHEYIRYVISRGQSLNRYTQEDMAILASHINSTRRAGLKNNSPYELANSEDMRWLLRVLDIRYIQPDEVHLLPDLLD